jgi:hypothetical protein
VDDADADVASIQGVNDLRFYSDGYKTPIDGIEQQMTTKFEQ